jgi:hypothetical protein
MVAMAGSSSTVGRVEPMEMVIYFLLFIGNLQIRSSCKKSINAFLLDG